MKVLVLGGDGFCGWPCAVNLADQGHEVLIVDNLSRRKIDIDLEVESLTPIMSISERLQAWAEIGGKPMKFVHMDVAHEYQRLLDLLCAEKPAAVVHFAEQRAAPYSMKSSATKRYTVDNNVNGTHNLLAAIVESGLDVHVVHLGTMGVYGYGSHRGATIPEGYLKVEVPQPDGSRFEEEILHPASPGSVYHMTKTLDQLLFLYYNKNDKVKITDLHQGIVWGTNTESTDRDPRLTNRFDYDGDYGTVLNRFLMQAAIGYPLTVHGTGGQTRAFIHIRDSVRCVQLALDNPPEQGERVKIFNQMTESHQVGKLASKVAALTGAQVSNLPNPRNEAVENDLIVDNRCFIELGLSPTTLDDGLLKEVVGIAARYSDRCDRNRILAPRLGLRTKPRLLATPPYKTRLHPLKIAFFTETFLPKVDGIVTRLTRTIKHLVDAGDEVVVFCPDGCPDEYMGARLIGIPAMPLPLYPELKLALPRPAVSEAIDTFRPGLIHVVNPAVLGLGGIWLAKMKNIPLVASYHTHLPKYLEHYGMGMLEPLLWELLKAAHNKALLNLCTSTAMVQELSEKGIQHTALWQRGVDTELFRPDLRSTTLRRRLLGGHDDRGTLLLYVGRLSAEKQIERIRPVLEALPDARLALVGDGPHRYQLEKYFAGTPTTFVGYLAGEELASAYASGDAFLFPSSTETLGLVLLEAMASGCPVVGANRGGVTDIITDGVNGCLYEPDGAEDSLIEATKKLVGNDLERQALRSAARSEAERWGWAGATEQLRSYYHSILN